MEENNVQPIPAHAPRDYRQATTPRRKLVPGTIGAMIIGYFAVVLCWFSVIPIAGIVFFIPSFIMGLLAFLRGRKLKVKMLENPVEFSPVSEGFLKAARITGLISVIAASVGLLTGIIWMIAAGGPEHIF
jgi:hypothetical protein